MSKSSNKKTVKKTKPALKKPLLIEKPKAQKANNQNDANSIDYTQRLMKIQEQYTKFIIAYGNGLFEDNLEVYKELLSCTNLEDMMDFQEKFVNHNLKHCFNKTIHTSNELIEFINEISDLIVDNCQVSFEKLFEHKVG